MSSLDRVIDGDALVRHLTQDERTIDQGLVAKHGRSARTLVKETYAGLISRAFSVPEEVDAKGATARFEHGILKLTLPKREGHAGRTLTIE